MIKIKVLKPFGGCKEGTHQVLPNSCIGALRSCEKRGVLTIESYDATLSDKETADVLKKSENKEAKDANLEVVLSKDTEIDLPKVPDKKDKQK